MSEKTRAAQARRCGVMLPLLAALACAAAAMWVAPASFDAAWQLYAQDDPALLADRMMAKTFDATIAQREIDAALASGDPDLAESFVALAQARSVALDPALADRVTQASSTTAAASRAAGSFAQGLVTGEPTDTASLAGTAVGDLFVFGDIRDAVREGSRLATGEQADELVLGLACVGIAVTAGTYATLGVGTPVRVGLSLMKAARKTGRIGAALGEWAGRSVRAMVDVPAMRRAITDAPLAPLAAVRATRDAVKIERAGGLLEVVGDVGRVQSKAGTRAALDGLKLAEGPRDVSRLARLAAAKGPQTRAILKLAGRAAIVLTRALFDLASWVFGALVAVFGFCSAVQGFTERATLRYVRWRKARRLRARERALEMAPA